VERAMADVVAGEPAVVLDYAVLVDADDLELADDLTTDQPLRLLIAATVDRVRLIDNLDPRGLV
jgi:pantothenate synthetase